MSKGSTFKNIFFIKVHNKMEWMENWFRDLKILTQRRTVKSRIFSFWRTKRMFAEGIVHTWAAPREATANAFQHYFTTRGNEKILFLHSKNKNKNSLGVRKKWVEMFEVESNRPINGNEVARWCLLGGYWDTVMYVNPWTPAEQTLAIVEHVWKCVRVDSLHELEHCWNVWLIKASWSIKFTFEGQPFGGQ